jgi:beta-galactosidase
MYPRRTTFDDGWYVHEGEVAPRPLRLMGKANRAKHLADLTTSEIPAGAAQNMLEMTAVSESSRPAALDDRWRPVRLPHDWRIGHSPSPDHPESADYPRAAQGFWPTGVAYYRKTFDQVLPDAGEHLWVRFDGIVGLSDVWLNGFWLGTHSSSYSAVAFDITPFLRPPTDGPNVLLVRSDCTEAEGWWYEGGGIYRHAWLETHGDVHVPRDGVFITTPQVTPAAATVRLEIEVANWAAEGADVTTSVLLRDPTGAAVGTASTEATVGRTSPQTAVVEIVVERPRLWNIGDGQLHTAEVALHAEGQTTWHSVHSFGIRSIEVVADAVIVNGVEHKALGVNLHQDFAGVGVALPDRLIEAKLELFREMGANTLRSAHHPPTPELVAHADRLGMLVIPENRLLSTAPSHLQHLRTMVRAFRNHPSVFVWSLENEEMSLEGTPTGEALLRRLHDEVRDLDSSRPTIVGGAQAFDSSYHRIPDIAGIHYPGAISTLSSVVACQPDKPHLQDEVGLFASTRGVYEPDELGRPSAFATVTEILSLTFPNIDEIIAAVAPDHEGAAPFRINDDVPAQMTEAFTSPLTAGACVWTGMDYHGEPTPMGWPRVVTGYGARDLVGIPKDYYWLLRALFRPEPLVHAFPHWTWPGREGGSIPFRVYSNCEEIEVVINDVVIARQAVLNTAARFDGGVTYAPGELLVRGLRDGEVVAEHLQRTAGPAAGLVVQTDRTTLAADGLDVVVARVAVVDTAGVLVPTSDHLLTFSIDGDARVIGVGNGDPAMTEPSQACCRSAFKGFAAAIVQAGRTPGTVALTASAPGLEAARVDLRLETGLAPHQVHTGIDELVGPAGVHRAIA